MNIALLAHDGKKELTGMLENAGEEGVTLNTGNTVLTVEYKNISKANLCDFE